MSATVCHRVIIACIYVDIYVAHGTLAINYTVYLAIGTGIVTCCFLRCLGDFCFFIVLDRSTDLRLAVHTK